MEGNRNLSSIISKIRDDGPPGGGDRAEPDTPVEAGPAVHSDTDTRQHAPVAPAGRRISHKLLRGLLLPLAIIVGMMVFAASYTAYHDDGGFSGITRAVRGWFAPASGAAGEAAMPDRIAAATGAVDEQMVRDLQARQLEITFRLDQLADTVTALSETIKRNWADNDTVITGLREEQRAALEAIEVRVKALQQQLAGVTEKPAGTVTAPPTARSGSKTTAASAKATAAPAKVPAAKDKPEQSAAGEEWVVNIASSSHDQAMQDMAAKLQAQGIPVERHTLTIEGDLMYRLRVPGFATSAEARSYARKLEKESGLKGGWISRK